MVDPHSTIMTTDTSRIEEYNKLSDKWTLWAHLPHDTDWSIKSYKQIFTVSNVEETIAITETLPPILVQNCMLFWMREGIKPTWEDPKNRNGGCFSYKVINKQVVDVWKTLMYALCGETLCINPKYRHLLNGITISPKKNFCIIKIWLADCSVQDPEIIINVPNLTKQGCLFKKHAPEF